MIYFKKISFGGLTTVELLNRLNKANIQFNEYAHLLFNHPAFSISQEKIEVELVKVSLKDLNLVETCTYVEFNKKIDTMGLQLCPLNLAAYLRLEYIDQPEGPYLTIASPKPEEKIDFPNGFYLRNDKNQLWLRGYQADGFEGWPQSNEFVLIKT